MVRTKKRAAFTLVELMVVVVIVGVLALASVPMFRTWNGNQRAKAEARSVSDLLTQARSEAIRTGENHIVFFRADTVGANLVDQGGVRAAALLASDANQNGLAAPNEFVGSVPWDRSGSVSPGSAQAGSRAPGDPRGADDTPPISDVTFVEQDGVTLANWVVFFPDGIPRSYSVGGFDAGQVGSGAGAIYMTTGDRDYAVVLAPLGGTRVYAWEAGTGLWK